MVTLIELAEDSDLSTIDFAQLMVGVAEVQMQDYQANRGNGSALVYLLAAEDNLLWATSKGKDTTRQYRLLRSLQAECWMNDF